MITFTALDSGIRVASGDATLLVFPSADTKVENGVTHFLAVPQEEPEKGKVSWPGEYDMQGVSFKGIAHLEGQQVSYVARLDGVRLAFLSTPLQVWDDAQLEAVGDIDVLIIPMDNQKLVQRLVDQIDPRVLILVPTDDNDAYSAIFKAIGAKEDAVMKEYKLKGSLPQEGREVVVLAK